MANLQLMAPLSSMHIQTAKSFSFDDRMKTKCVVVNKLKPRLVQYNMSFWMTPSQTLSIEGYENHKKKLLHKLNGFIRSYLHDSSDFLDFRHILDVDYTTANMKFGFKKFVTFSFSFCQNSRLRYTPDELIDKVSRGFSMYMEDWLDEFEKLGYTMKADKKCL